MVGENFTANYLQKLYERSGNKILDGFGNEISTLSYEKNPDFRINFNKPKIIFDIFESKLKTPRILRYGQHHTMYITRLGLVVISIPVRKRAERWLRFQRTKYQLKLSTDMIPLDGNIVKIPEDHWAEVDVNNFRARLGGRYTSQNGYTDWVWYG